MRDNKEIQEKINKLQEVLWHFRHTDMKDAIEIGRKTVDPDVWQLAEEKARQIEEKYGKEYALGDDYEWCGVYGELAALRWATGEEWDVGDIRGY